MKNIKDFYLTAKALTVLHVPYSLDSGRAQPAETNIESGASMFPHRENLLYSQRLSPTGLASRGFWLTGWGGQAERMSEMVPAVAGAAKQPGYLYWHAPLQRTCTNASSSLLSIKMEAI